MVFARYVALGDSSTEGLDDPDGRGGYRGWANRLAERIAASQRQELLYANLGVRGRRTRQVRHEQLAAALALAPDLATLFVGTNDVMARRFDVEGVGADLTAMQQALIAAGATVLSFTLPDLGPVMPWAKGLAPRVEALNRAIRQSSSATGARLVDFARYPVASDPRLWSEDRLHANAVGHQRIAAALGAALSLPGTDEGWSEPLPAAAPQSRRQRFAVEARWILRHLVPWIARHAVGRSSGDGRRAKRPRLLPVRGG